MKLLIALTLIGCASTARILAFIPTPSYSHQIYFHPLWIALAERGHDVVVATTDPIKNTTALPSNLHQIDMSAVHDTKSKDLIAMRMGGTSMKMMRRLIHFLVDSLDYELSLKQVQREILNKKQHFDLIIVESVIQMTVVLREHLNITNLIVVSSLDAPGRVYSALGNPDHNALYPTGTLPFRHAETLLQRFNSIAYWLLIEFFEHYVITPRQNAIMLKHFGRVYDVQENIERAALQFVNTNPIFYVTRPVTPSTVNLYGGMHINEPKPLPADVESFLDANDDGVVYFSLGSNVKSKDLTFNVREIILQAFAMLPYKVLWKFENDNLPGKPINVFISKWLPQQDVLRHHNVKMFITQCGLQSLEEAFYLHVPILGIPFFADQHGNAEAIIKHRIGLTIDYKTMSSQSLHAAIIEIMTNRTYADNIRKLAQIVNDQPMTAIERAVWWTEYVLRHNGAPFSHGPKLPAYKYYYLDIFTILSVVLYIVYQIIKLLIRCACKYVRCIPKKQHKS